MRFSVVQNFSAKVRVSMPDPDRAGVVKPLEFTAKFKSQSASPEARDELQRLQDEQGLYALMDSVLVDVSGFPEGATFYDENDEEITAVEWVKRNQFATGAAIAAFWEVVNKDVEAKNSKRSR